VKGELEASRGDSASAVTKTAGNKRAPTADGARSPAQRAKRKLHKPTNEEPQSDERANRLAEAEKWFADLLAKLDEVQEGVRLIAFVNDANNKERRLGLELKMEVKGQLYDIATVGESGQAEAGAKDGAPKEKP
jgi:hypothetical protein